jgi:RNA polymerase sigma factor (TIGR02999 family)
MRSHDVTRLLQRWREGDEDALDELVPLIYDELRRIARSFMRRQRAGHTLQPTALINEAFLKLFQDAHPVITDRAHFLALMSRVMRQVLVDHARAHVAAKRGGREERIPWDSNIDVGAGNATEQLRLLDLHRALEALEREEPALAQVLELHYFGGMTAEEAALALGRSVHVIRHQLRIARAWLRRELAG